MGSEDGGFLNLSLTEKVQLGAFATGTLIFILTYLVFALLNGFGYANHWISQNKIPVLFYWLIQFALLPVYNWAFENALRPVRRTDDFKIKKWFKQSVWTFIWSGLPFVAILVYYSYNPPAPGIDRVVYRLSLLLVGGTFMNLILSTGSYRYKTKG